MRRSIVLAILLVFAIFVVLAHAGKPAPPGTPAIQGIARLDGTVNNPTPHVQYDLVSLTGPGTFIGGRIGANGLTSDDFTVRLEIDGVLVVNEDIHSLGEGYVPMNPMGITGFCRGEGIAWGICLGFIQPVAYNSSLTLSIVPAGPLNNAMGTILYAD